MAQQRNAGKPMQPAKHTARAATLRPGAQETVEFARRTAKRRAASKAAKASRRKNR